jgi:hypothetical protein
MKVHYKALVSMPVLMLSLGLLAGCSAPESHVSPSFDPNATGTIAVVAEDRTGKIPKYGFLRECEDVFAAKLMAKGYRIAARRDAEAVEKELVILTDDEVVEIGRVLRADAVMIVSITDFGQSSEIRSGEVTYRDVRTRERTTRWETRTVHSAFAAITARLIDLNREILWSGSHRDSCIMPDSEQVGSALRSVAKCLAESFPDRFGEKRASPHQRM